MAFPAKKRQFVAIID